MISLPLQHQSCATTSASASVWYHLARLQHQCGITYTDEDTRTTTTQSVGPFTPYSAFCKSRENVEPIQKKRDGFSIRRPLRLRHQLATFRLRHQCNNTSASASVYYHFGFGIQCDNTSHFGFSISVTTLRLQHQCGNASILLQHQCDITSVSAAVGLHFCFGISVPTLPLQHQCANTSASASV